MFKFTKELKRISTNIERIGGKYLYKDTSTKNKIHKLFIFGVLGSLLIGLGIYLLPSSQNNSHYQTQSIKSVEQIEGTEQLPQGQGLPNPIDILNPISSFQKSFIDGISELILQGIDLFDDYVAFTPNIAKSDGSISDSQGRNININLDKFYRVTQNIAWLLLPLVIVFIGSSLLIDGSQKGGFLLKEFGKKILLFAIGMVAIRFFFSIAIDLTNALNNHVLRNLIGESNSLSQSLLYALGLSVADNKLQFSQQGLNTFGELILWIGLFFLLVSLLFQFIIRFFYLLLYLISYPIVFLISLLPEGQQFFKSYIEEVLRTLFMQPIFLIGLAVAIQVINSVDKPVPKVILGIGSIVFLNLIPAIVNKFSGVMWGYTGKAINDTLARYTVGQAQKLIPYKPVKWNINNGNLGERIVKQPYTKASNVNKNTISKINTPRKDYFIKTKKEEV